MILTKLSINSYGRIEKLDLGLEKISIIETPYIEEVSCAISELIYSEYLRPNLPPIKTSEKSSLSCEILANKLKIIVEVLFNEGKAEKKYYVEGKEIDFNELPIKDSSFEQEMTSLFLNRLCFDNCKNLLFYQDYKNYFAYYKGSIEKTLPSTEFSFLFGEKYFRSLLNNFIRNFKSIWIDREKGIYFRLNNSGEFVSFKDYAGKPRRYSLSEKDKIIFEFIIFLEIGRFWGEINRIKDLHWESKPLIVLNLLEKLDNKFNAESYIKEVKQNRQIIFLKEKIN